MSRITILAVVLAVLMVFSGTALAVDRLLISEVFYDPIDTDDTYEWIELFNGSSTSIDLSLYELKWGGTVYTHGIYLQGMLNSGGYFVVGGPMSDANNYYPYFNQAADLAPDLQNSGADADAVALFEIGNPIPIDAVIYGVSNTNNLIDETGNPGNVDIGDALSGQSIARISDSGSDDWIFQSQPDPGAGSLYADEDGDGIPNVDDNCPNDYNPGQENNDADGYGNACDNCPNNYNPGQENNDGDGSGDVCDADDDNDTIPDDVEGNSDPDSDGIPNWFDTDSDGDGILDSIEASGDPYRDTDDDGLPDFLDLDSDEDTFSDAIEAAGDPYRDTDSDGIPDYRDADSDNDDVQDQYDNCRLYGNSDQANSDTDEYGNVCDNCWQVSNPDQADTDADCPGMPYSADPKCGDACEAPANQCLADIAPIDALDCKVDLSDLVVMKQEFNRKDCSPSNPCHADIAPSPVDNKVDLSDLVVMKQQFNRKDCCP